VDVISCEGLTRRFGTVAVVSGLDLGVCAGLVYGFPGPDGAGKTTTIRMLLGLVVPSAGQVALLGRRLPDPRVTARTGSMIEEPAFCPWMTGRGNLEVPGATGGGCVRGEVARVLGVAGLAGAADRKVRTCSQGMRQRLGTAARLLARWPATCTGGQFLVGHGSGRDVNGALVAGGVAAEPVTAERPGLEDRFLEITGTEDAHGAAAGS
jgi:ABC-type multidrug transport system ATPase subunit